MNIEQGHAILAGHSFEHEIAMANAFGIFGSIDMNRNDYQSGWDTDQFPNNVPEMALAYYHVLSGGGFQTGGTNFDAKLRRQSIDPQDLLIGHIGAFDCCARGLKAAAKMVEDKALSAPLAERYAGWKTAEAQATRWQQVSVAFADLSDRETALRENARVTEQTARQRAEQVRAEVAAPVLSAARTAPTE